MTSRRDRMTGLWCLALAWVGSCAVFPDVATLPNPSVLPGVGGEPPSPGGAGGEPDAPQPTAGNAVGGSGGKPTNGGQAGVPMVGGAGGDPASSGAGGEGGVPGPTCANPVDQTVTVARDTWLEQAVLNANHGSDSLLYLVGDDGSERRALFQLQLPEIPEGAELLNATFEISLQQNADKTGAERHVALQRSLHLFDESKANWQQFDSGSKGDWGMEGGDLVGFRAEASIPADSIAGSVSFDAKPVIEAMFAPNVEVALFVTELGVPPAAPAELAFMSRQGDASQAPKLHLRYCPP